MEGTEMKKPFNPVIPDYTPRSEKKKEEVVSLSFNPCCHCGKAIVQGYYGRWGNAGTCSKTCEKEQEKKPRYPESKLEGEDHVSIPS